MTHHTHFTHTGLPMRVVFGTGRMAEIPRELDRLGLSRVMVICTPLQEDLGSAVAALIGDRSHSVYPHAAMHVPTAVADAAIDYAQTHKLDGCVTVGGGSSVGLAKAVALRTGLPTVALPTTYAGSEMTPIWGLTDANEKTTGRDPIVLPRSVIYDPELTVTLPAELSATSGLNALAHAAEALYAPDASPIIDLIAGDATRTLAASLPKVVDDPTDIDARSDALYGAWLSGVCLGATTMSLHHKLCHVLGGTYDLPHAQVHTTVLPYVLAHNLDAAPRAREILSAAVGSDDPAMAIYELERRMGVTASLNELGMPEAGIETVVAKATANPYANPVEVTPEIVRDIITRAYTGNPPA